MMIAPAVLTNHNNNHTDTNTNKAATLFRRAATASSSSSSYRGRDCKVAVLLDDFYVQSFVATGGDSGTNGGGDPWDQAKARALAALGFADQFYRKFVDVGLPVALVAKVGAGSGQGGDQGDDTDFDSASSSAEELLGKLQRAIDGGRGMFGQLRAPQYCLVHLVTHQDFGLKLGTAFVAEPGTGGVCDPYGYNTAISNTYLAGERTTLDTFKHSLTHEIGHNMGTSLCRVSVFECAHVVVRYVLCYAMCASHCAVFFF